MSTKIMVLWGTIVVTICIFLIIIGNIGSDYNLFLLEKELKFASREYLIEKDRYPEFNMKEVVFIEELLSENLVKSTDELDKYCIKSVEITNKFLVDEFEVVKKCKLELKESE